MDETVKIEKQVKETRKKQSGKRFAAQKYFYLPETQRTKAGTVFAGISGRSAAAWLAVWGLLLFINDAFMLGGAPGFLALVSFIPTALLTLAAYSRTGALITIGSASVTAALYMIFTHSPLENAYAAILSLYSKITARLSSLGYRTAPVIAADSGFTADPSVNLRLINTGFVFIGIILAAIFTLSAAKRVRMLPIAITGGTICVFIFTYNLVERSWGFTLMLTSLCGLIVMRACEGFLCEAPHRKDKISKDRRGGRAAVVPSEDNSAGKASQAKTGSINRIKSAALGGLAGLAAMAVAFSALLFPTLSVRRKWEEIEPINIRMEIARQILSSFIIGDRPDFSDLGYLGKMDLLTSRSAAASDRVFTGAKIMEVRSNYNLPIYLRSFVSGDYEADNWLVPRIHEISVFNDTFGKDFTGEQVAYDFFDTVNPKLNKLNNYANYISRIENGFITTSVDIKLASTSGNLLFLPSRYEPNTGLLSYGGSAESPYEEDYSFYSDGILSTSWFNFNKSYRTLAFLQSYRHENAFNNLERLNKYYKICRGYIEQSMEITDADYSGFVAAELAMQELEDYIDGNAYERWLALDDRGRTEFYNRFISSDSYGKYVYDNYGRINDADYPALFDHALAAVNEAYPGHSSKMLSKSLSNELIVFEGKPFIKGEYQLFSANSLFPDVSVFEKVMAVINYLKNNYTYSLTPKNPSDKRLTSVDAFLNNTKEGYCVQFATSAALMLRVLGVPTRYCEGYIASEFKLDKSEAGEGRYLYTVRDYNAHAWIEVYIDNIGWMTFETTPEYYSEMYEHYSVSGDYNTDSYDPPPYIPPEDINIEPGTKSDKFDIAALITSIAIGFAALAAVGAAAYFVYRFITSSREARYMREDFISKALRSGRDEEFHRTTAVAIIDYIEAALAAAGLRPRTGELPVEYRDRCERVLRGDEQAKPAVRNGLKLPAAIKRIISKLDSAVKAIKARRRAAEMTKKTRSGSLGIADEFADAKKAQGKESVTANSFTAASGYTQVFDFIRREEFGDGMSADELQKCAVFLTRLSTNIYAKKKPVKRFWLRHVKHAI